MDKVMVASGGLAVAIALLCGYIAHLLEQLIPTTIVIFGLGFSAGVLILGGSALVVKGYVDVQGE